MNATEIMRRHPATFPVQLKGKDGICPICGMYLVREPFEGRTDMYYVCCPSHEHGSYVAGDDDE
jgi:hypothetical protein